MISTDLAVRLRDAGLIWRPQPGDRFVIAAPELSGQVFTLSDMTIEAHEYPSGTVLGFNGTTEWALDSVTIDKALWLPAEDQLRELLGGTFRCLDTESGGYRVHLDGSDPDIDDIQIVAADSAADAYALAVLALMSRLD